MARAVTVLLLNPRTAEKSSGMRSLTRTVAQYLGAAPFPVGGAPVPDAMVTFCFPVGENPFSLAYRHPLSVLYTAGVGGGSGHGVSAWHTTLTEVQETPTPADSTAAATAALAADCAAACAASLRKYDQPRSTTIPSMPNMTMVAVENISRV